MLRKMLFAWVWVALLVLSAWCTGALWYQDWVTAPAGKVALMAAFGVAMLAALVLGFRRRRYLALGLALALGLCAAWCAFQHPVPTDDWDPPFAVLPKVTFSPDGGTFTVENLRDFHYRSEDDYDIRYRNETYAFDDLVSLDYSITHWEGNETFAHIIVSFGFRDGRHLAFSPEARMKPGKRYELLPGLYRQYQMVFILATEEDVIQLRTNHRAYEQSTVYFYPTIAEPALLRFVLRDLLERVNAIGESPEYYNVLAYNCLNSFAPTAEKVGITFCSGWRGAVNGLSDRHAWRLGWFRGVRPGESFEDYRKRHLVNQYVEHLVDPPNFSRLIRPDE